MPRNIIGDYVLGDIVEVLPEGGDSTWSKLVCLAMARGIKVYLVDKLVGNALGFHFDRAAIILIDGALGNTLRCFVMAHELGHTVLHSGKLNKPMYFNNKEYYLGVEREANAYAERLLRFIYWKLQNKRGDSPDQDPEPPAAGGVDRKRVVTTAISGMAA